MKRSRDEPSNPLDALSAEQIRRYIEGCDKSILFMTHDEKMAKQADQIVLLRERSLTG